jgi:hypothetical protein
MAVMASTFRTIVLPCHSGIYSIWDSHGGHCVPPWRHVTGLETVLEEGFAQIKQKNVELWKVLFSY